jgi:hypothetical protein
MMVGRDRELKVLTKLAASDQPRVALIAGEPGIGKTRLTNELLATLPSEHVVLVGHAEPGSLSRPYEVLLDAVHYQPRRLRRRPFHRYGSTATLRDAQRCAGGGGPVHPPGTVRRRAIPLTGGEIGRHAQVSNRSLGLARTPGRVPRTSTHRYRTGDLPGVGTGHF